MMMTFPISTVAQAILLTFAFFFLFRRVVSRVIPSRSTLCAPFVYIYGLFAGISPFAYIACLCALYYKGVLMASEREPGTCYWTQYPDIAHFLRWFVLIYLPCKFLVIFVAVAAQTLSGLAEGRVIHPPKSDIDYAKYLRYLRRKSWYDAFQSLKGLFFFRAAVDFWVAADLSTLWYFPFVALSILGSSVYVEFLTLYEQTAYLTDFLLFPPVRLWALCVEINHSQWFWHRTVPWDFDPYVISRPHNLQILLNPFDFYSWTYRNQRTGSVVRLIDRPSLYVRFRLWCRKNIVGIKRWWFVRNHVNQSYYGKAWDVVSTHPQLMKVIDNITDPRSHTQAIHCFSYAIALSDCSSIKSFIGTTELFIGAVCGPEMVTTMRQSLYEAFQEYLKFDQENQTFTWDETRAGIKSAKELLKSEMAVGVSTAMGLSIWAVSSKLLGWKNDVSLAKSILSGFNVSSSQDYISLMCDILVYVGDNISATMEGKWTWSNLVSRPGSSGDMDELYHQVVSKEPMLMCGKLTTDEENAYLTDLATYIAYASRLLKLTRSGMERTMLDRRYAKVLEINVRLESARRNRPLRPAPLGIKFSGFAGVGKSTIVLETVKHVFHINGFSYDAKRVAHYSEDDNFDSMLMGDTDVVIYDDSPILRPEFTKTYPSHFLTRMINNAPYIATKAEIDLKGRISVVPKVVAVTSNIEDLDACKYATCPSATMRRLLHVDVQVAGKFALSDGQLDTEKLKEAKLYTGNKVPDAHLFTIRHWKEKKNSNDRNAQLGEFVDDPVHAQMTTVKFLRFLTVYSRDYYAKQAAAVAACSDNGTAFCEICEISVNRCPCGTEREPSTPPPPNTPISGVSPENSVPSLPLSICVPPSEESASLPSCSPADSESYNERAWAAQMDELELVNQNQRFHTGFAGLFVTFLSYWAVKRQIRRWRDFAGEQLTSLCRFCAQVERLRDWVIWILDNQMKIIVLFGLVPGILSFFFPVFGIFLILFEIGTCMGLFAFLRKVSDFMSFVDLRRYVNNKHLKLLACICACASGILAIRYFMRTQPVNQVERDSIEINEQFHGHGYQQPRFAMNKKMMTMDPDTISDKISTSVFAMTFDYGDGTKSRGNGLSLGTSWVLTNKHSLLSKHGKMEGTFDIRSGTGTWGGNVSKIPYSISNVSIVYDDGGYETDLAVVHLAGQGGSRYDIMPFLNDSLSGFETRRGVEFYRDPEGNIITSAVKIGYNGCREEMPTIGGPLRVTDDLREDNTFCGLSGATRCVFRAERPVVIALHSVGTRHPSPNGWGSLIVKSQISDAMNRLLERNPSLLRPVNANPEHQTFTMSEHHYQKTHPKSVAARLPEDAEVIVNGGSSIGLTRPVTSMVDLPIQRAILEHTDIEKTHGPPKNLGNWEATYAEVLPRVSSVQGPPPDILQRAFEDFSVLKKKAYERNPPGPPLSLARVINGFANKPGAERMKLSTSMGCPFNKQKHQIFTMTDDYMEDGTRIAECRTDFAGAFFRLDDMIRQGLRLHLPFSMTQKDELVKLGKEKVRSIMSINVLLSMLVRKYFLPVWMSQLKFPLMHEIAVCVRAYSRQWTKTGKYIHSAGGKSRTFAGDFEKFDALMWAQIFCASLKMDIDAALASGNYSETDRVAMEVLAEELSHPTVEVLSTILEFIKGVCSGHNGTVHLNCTSNSLGMRCSFYAELSERIANGMKPKLTPSEVLLLPGVTSATSPEMLNLLRYSGGFFHDFVSLVTYGDDLAGSVSEKIDFFDNMIIYKWSTAWGMRYTDENKQIPSEPFVEFDTISFLKRKFVWDEENDRYLAPLELTSISKCLLMGDPPKPATTGISIQEHCAGLIGTRAGRGQMFEYYYHGREVYEKMEKGINAAIADANQLDCKGISEYFIDGRVPTYEQQHSFWESKYDVQNQCEFIAPDIPEQLNVEAHVAYTIMASQQICANRFQPVMSPRLPTSHGARCLHLILAPVITNEQRYVPNRFVTIAALSCADLVTYVGYMENRFGRRSNPDSVFPVQCTDVGWSRSVRIHGLPNEMIQNSRGAYMEVCAESSRQAVINMDGLNFLIWIGGAIVMSPSRENRSRVETTHLITEW